MSTTTKKTTKVTIKKDAENKIVNTKFTEAEVAEMQRTAQDAILDFDTALEKLLAKSDYNIVKKNSKNEVTVSHNALRIKLCYKHNKVACYTNVASNELRNECIKRFKYSKEIHTVTNARYLDSTVNKEFQVTIAYNTADAHLKTLIADLFTAYEACLTESKKALKKAK